MGATKAATPAALAEQCDVVFAMVSDPQAALEVATGPDGVAAGLSPGKGYVDASTVDAATSRAIHAAVKAKGGLFLEAPVSGSKGPAENGQLIFLTGGDQQLFDYVQHPLSVMGKASLFLGEVISNLTFFYSLHFAKKIPKSFQLAPFFLNKTNNKRTPAPSPPGRQGRGDEAGGQQHYGKHDGRLL